MNIQRSVRIGTALIGVIALTSVAACDKKVGPTGCPVLGPAAMVMAAHANTPQATPVPTEITNAMRAALTDHRPVAVIAIDGKPHAAKTIEPTTDAANGQAAAQDVEIAMSDLTAAATSVQGAVAESDPLTALDLAARTVGEHGYIGFIDSGLGTTGMMTFADGKLDAEPDDVARYLDKVGYLPDLRGRSVVFAGLGDVVPPQADLGTPYRRNVISIWTAIARAGGAACVKVIETPRTGVAAGSLPVRPIDVPGPPGPEDWCGPRLIPDGGDTGFKPDSAEFRDPTAASRALKVYADYLIAHSASATLTGMTATAGTEAGRLSLSQHRADAVKAVLSRYGVPTSAVTAIGVGTHSPHHVNDLVNGVLQPGPAAHNRAVVIEILAVPGC